MDQEPNIEIGTGLRELNNDGHSLVDQIAREVRRAIVEGELRPGEPLSITTIAENLNISTIPVREALQRLAGQGFITLRRSRRAVIAPLEVEDLKEVYRLRLLVEVDAAARAVRLLTDEDIEGLRAELEGMANQPRDSERFWHHHDAFHLRLIEPAATPRLRRMIEDFWKAAERYIRLTYMAGGEMEVRSVRERHLPLMDAAEKRSAALMRKTLRDHLQISEHELVKRITVIQESASKSARP